MESCLAREAFRFSLGICLRCQQDNTCPIIRQETNDYQDGGRAITQPGHAQFFEPFSLSRLLRPRKPLKYFRIELRQLKEPACRSGRRFLTLLPSSKGRYVHT